MRERPTEIKAERQTWSKTGRNKRNEGSKNGWKRIRILVARVSLTLSIQLYSDREGRPPCGRDQPQTGPGAMRIREKK